jgi:hypothetical protein
MSWYGLHARMSKAKMKMLLPPAACKRCVYWFRIAFGASPANWAQDYEVCSRCGIQKWAILAELNRELLELSTPHVPRARETLPPLTLPDIIAASAKSARWFALYRSTNRAIRLRAAKALLDRADTPDIVVLDILDTLAHFGLGAATLRELRRRASPELAPRMIDRLDARDEFVREAACDVLGRCQDKSATPHLLRMVDDPVMSVRSAAARALGLLKDVAAVTVLRQQLANRPKDNSEVVWALELAIRDIEADAP